MATLALIVVSTACKESPDPADPEPDGGAGGSAGAVASLELEPLQVTMDSDLIPLVDGADALLSHAIQGGQVFYVNARVRGLESSFIVATARIVDPESDVVHTEQTRTLELVADPSDASAMIPSTDSFSNFVHLVVCPNYAERDIMSLPWRLELDIREAYGARSGSTELSLTPICPADAVHDLCVCECTARYDLRVCGNPR